MKKTANTDIEEIFSFPPKTPAYRLPLFVDGSKFSCLVVGGGKGAVRKLTTLIEAGVFCTVVSPTCLPEILQWVEDGKIFYWQKSYEPTDVKGFRIVIAATADTTLNDNIGIDARQEGALFSSLSTVYGNDFSFAASAVEKGLTMGVATQYQLPEVGKLLRDNWLARLPENLETLLMELSICRKHTINTQREEDKQHYKTLLLRLKELLQQI